MKKLVGTVIVTSALVAGSGFVAANAVAKAPKKTLYTQQEFISTFGCEAPDSYDAKDWEQTYVVKTTVYAIDGYRTVVVNNDTSVSMLSALSYLTPRLVCVRRAPMKVDVIWETS